MAVQKKLVTLNDENEALAVQEKLCTADEFWEIAHLPENLDNVYTPDETKTLGIEDTLVGGDVLPGLMLPVKVVFEG